MKGPLVTAGAQAVALLVALAHRWRAITTAQETRHEVERGAILHMAVSQGLAIIKDAAAEGEAHTAINADSCLHRGQLICRVCLERQGLPIESPREDLHRDADVKVFLTDCNYQFSRL